MTTWLTLGVVLFGVLASAQVAENFTRMAAAPVVLPRPNLPISLEQIEERTRKLKNGTTDVEVIKSKIYRDSAGRLRIESDIREGPGHSSIPYIDLVDPVIGSRVLLLSTQGVAYRMPFQKSAESKFAVLGTGGGATPSHNSTEVTEAIGTRMIEGFEFDGTRVVQTSDGGAQPTYIVEHWYSDELKLIGDIVTSDPHELYTARIHSLLREEPDPALFTIPPSYKIVDLQLPSSDRQ